MADTGVKFPGTGADDNAVGTITWSDPTNAQTDNASYASASLGPSGGGSIFAFDYHARLVKGGVVSGDENASQTTALNKDTPAVITYGGASDLWGLDLTYEDINAADFGFVFAAKRSAAGSLSHYLKATGFGFNVPANTIINGIEVNVETYYTNPTVVDAFVDYITIKVYYTELSTEDFTTYTEVDASGLLAETISRVTFTNLGRDDEAYLYKDKTADHFAGDFEHLIDIKITGSVAAGWFGVATLTNVLDDLKGIDTANESFLTVGIYGNDANTFDIFAWEGDSGTDYFSADTWYTANKDTTYYLKIKRDEAVGTYGTLYVYVYTDAARTTLVNTTTVALHTSKKDYRYCMPVCSYNTTTASKEMSGYLENLDLQEAAPSTYNSPFPAFKRP